MHLKARLADNLQFYCLPFCASPWQRNVTSDTVLGDALHPMVTRHCGKGRASSQTLSLVVLQHVPTSSKASSDCIQGLLSGLQSCQVSDRDVVALHAHDLGHESRRPHQEVKIAPQASTRETWSNDTACVVTCYHSSPLPLASKDLETAQFPCSYQQEEVGN